MIPTTLPVVDVSSLRQPQFEDELWRIEDERRHLLYVTRWDGDELSLSGPAVDAPELLLIIGDNRRRKA